MGIQRTAVVGALCAGLLSGCATMQTGHTASGYSQEKPFFCALAGAAIGGGGTAAIAGGPAIAAGAVIAAGLGYVACLKEEKVAEAPPPEPVMPPVVHHEEPAPPPPPAPPAEVTLGTISGIHFDFDKAVLKPAADPILNEVARKMQAEPSLRARIEGHTDNIGSDAYNMQLGQRRANAVRDALVARGIASHRLQAVSRGEREPIADNRTREGRAENRRVEIIGINN